MRFVKFCITLFFVIAICSIIKIYAAESFRIIDLDSKKECVGTNYIDSLANVIYSQILNENWIEVVRQSREALTAPDNVLNAYPNTYFIYEWYAHGLNALGKYKDVVDITVNGQRYAETSFLPTEAAYYNMRMMRVVAYILINRWEDARNTLSELEDICDSFGNGVVDKEIAALRNELHRAESTMNWRDDADQRVSAIFDAANSLLSQTPASLSGKKEWDKFFYFIITQLELFYFDINNPDDEKYWSRLLACAIVYFNTVGDIMPEREKLAYDLILLRKNFLDYHSGLLHKTPKRWQAIRDYLAPGELAVEITMCPDEILLLGSDYQAPVSIPIPDEITSRIEEYDLHDATSISQFYSEGSPLSALIDLLSPYLVGVHTLYLSPTNLFAQFNYGAIPYKNGCLDNYFDVVQMTTTADIDYMKGKTKAPSIKQVLLYGGIDYGNPTNRNRIGETYYSELADAISETRRGFGYLPHTLTEVESIAAMFQNSSLYIGEDASEQRVKSTDWPRMKGILHIATHGYSLSSPSLNDSTENSSKIMSIRSRSGLLMAGANYTLSGLSSTEDDGILTSQEIASLDMGNVELAVLSACSSGMGDLSNTTGVVYGVANAMKSAGVKRIVATLWDIPDEASAVAMQSFYQHLKSGNDITCSLRLMRQDMIHQGFTNPYYWAAFVNLE